MKTPIESARSRRSRIAERFASNCLSASYYRLAEYVALMAIVETELELREVERQILRAHLMIAAHYAALEQRPEGFDVLRVRLSAHVFRFAMLHHFVFVTEPVQRPEMSRFVRRNERNFGRDYLGHEILMRVGLAAIDDLTQEIAR